MGDPHDIAGPLRDAEDAIALAFARMPRSRIMHVPGGANWTHYQRLGKLLAKVRAMAAEMERRHSRAWVMSANRLHADEQSADRREAGDA